MMMMKKYTMGLGAALVLAAGVGLLSVRAADDKGIPTDTNKLADQVAKKDWAELTKEGATIAKKYDLDKIMYQFKLRNAPKNPGVGIGSKPGLIKPDGIEAKINNMAKRVTAGDLKYAKDLTRMTEIAAAIAGIAANVPSNKAMKTPADIQKWKEYAKEMHDASLDLIKALKGNNPAQVKAAAMTLQGSCTKCHADYRE
jgi:hypothetical protein